MRKEGASAGSHMNSNPAAKERKIADKKKGRGGNSLLTLFGKVISQE